MYQFANVLLSKARSAEITFLHAMSDRSISPTSKLLTVSYILKKNSRKFLSFRGTKIPFNSKKADFVAEDYFVICHKFMTYFNLVHMVFTIFLNFRVFKSYGKGSLSFGSILLNDSFKLLFDTHEQLILRRFNVIRNILVHSAFIELFLLLDENDFLDLQEIIFQMVNLESEFMDYCLKNSFFDNFEDFWLNIDPKAQNEK